MVGFFWNSTRFGTTGAGTWIWVSERYTVWDGWLFWYRADALRKDIYPLSEAFFCSMFEYLSVAYSDFFLPQIILDLCIS